MDVIFNNRQRPILPLPQVVEALERLRDDPQQLAHERDRLYDEPPPPYSESGETTEPPTPEPPPAVDKTYQREMRLEAHYKSTPISQFKSQAKRERERLLHQLSDVRYGRRQTLPWDNSLDLKANSENNIRSRWVEQGIWGDDWGPAWPKNSKPLTTKWLHEGGGPFHGPRNPTTSDSRPGARWGHEEPDPDPESESESEPKPESAPEQEQERRPVMSIFDPAYRQPERPKPPRRRPIGYIQTPWGPVARYPIPIPTVRNPEASRPYHQFVYQISKEREWIKDEMAHTAPGSAIDLDAMAYESVKNNWIKDGVWHPEWDDQPGRTWKHEEPEPEDEEEGVGEAPHPPSNPSSRRPSDTADDRQPTLTRYPNLFARAPIQEVANDPTNGGPTRGPRGAEADLPSLERSNIPSRPRRSKRTRESDTAVDEQPPKRSRYNTRHSRNVVTKGATLERAVSTTKRTRGERVGATSIPLRRSPRIAAKQAAQAANVPAEPQRGQPRSVQTKTAKRGRPRRGGRGRGDQNDTPMPRRNATKGARTVRAKTRK
ncbi:hypothetical protein B0T21DRAFT_295274 [Apiosordaria backusii]|uniref:Uncharacterized protein n=1 Tax=Apiosordaria backusii TaxID=314023 RepID=A0AA40AMR8_9PEZI|nr:hypothetical protein B0T21DRAFT_295274 [Apiosordaria backusii]